MKKLKTTKKIQNEFKLHQEALNKYCDKINREYARNMTKLVENIANGENLDIEMLKEKYLNNFDEKKEQTCENNDKTLTAEETVNVNSTSEVDTEVDSATDLNSEPNMFEEIIFDKIIINGKNYYYENKENGKIYDSSSIIVGVYKNKKYIIY